MTKRTLWSEFMKELDLKWVRIKTGFFKAIASLKFESMKETQKLERDIGIAGLMETGKIWDLGWFLSTKLNLSRISLVDCKKSSWHKAIT